MSRKLHKGVALWGLGRFVRGTGGHRGGFSEVKSHTSQAVNYKKGVKRYFARQKHIWWTQNTGVSGAAKGEATWIWVFPTDQVSDLNKKITKLVKRDLWSLHAQKRSDRAISGVQNLHPVTGSKPSGKADHIEWESRIFWTGDSAEVRRFYGEFHVLKAPMRFGGSQSHTWPPFHRRVARDQRGCDHGGFGVA